MKFLKNKYGINEESKLFDLKFNENLSLNIRSELDSKGYCLIRNVYDRQRVETIKRYLTGILNGSLPNYHLLEENCPNFFRINFDDQRSTVQTKSVQFNFFPWNQDFCGFFEHFGSLFEIRDRINEITSPPLGAPKTNSTTGLISRLAVQFYPAGGGYLQAHSDPIGTHQMIIANVVMSEYGVDYTEGGLFIKNSFNSSKEYPEREGKTGDVILFKADMVHGVDPIDPCEKFDPLRGTGRWMMLSAITKPSGSDVINNSKTYDN